MSAVRLASSCSIRCDCDASAGNGCECPGKDSGAGGCCAGGVCQTAHITGFGTTFYDCETTYTETLARDAAKASGFATPFGNTCGANMTESVICGPDPEPVLEKIREFEEAGFGNVYLHQVGRTRTASSASRSASCCRLQPRRRQAPPRRADGRVSRVDSAVSRSLEF